MKAIADMVRPVMERVYEDRKGQLDTNIYFPITDGHLGYNVQVDLQLQGFGRGGDLQGILQGGDVHHDRRRMARAPARNGRPAPERAERHL